MLFQYSFRVTYLGVSLRVQQMAEAPTRPASATPALDLSTAELRKARRAILNADLQNVAVNRLEVTWLPVLLQEVLKGDRTKLAPLIDEQKRQDPKLQKTLADALLVELNRATDNLATLTVDERIAYAKKWIQLLVARILAPDTDRARMRLDREAHRLIPEGSESWNSQRIQEAAAETLRRTDEIAAIHRAGLAEVDAAEAIDKAAGAGDTPAATVPADPAPTPAADIPAVTLTPPSPTPGTVPPPPPETEEEEDPGLAPAAALTPPPALPPKAEEPEPTTTPFVPPPPPVAVTPTPATPASAADEAAEIEELREKLKSETALLLKLNDQMAKLEHDNQVYQNKHAELRNQNADLTDQLQTELELRQKTEKELDGIKFANKVHVEEHGKLRGQMEDLKAVLVKSQEDLDKARKERAVDTASRNRHALATEQENERIQRSLDLKEQEVAAMKKQVGDFIESNKKRIAERRQLEEAYTQLEAKRNADRSRYDQQLARLQQQLQDTLLELSITKSAQKADATPADPAAIVPSLEQELQQSKDFQKVLKHQKDLEKQNNDLREENKKLHEEVLESRNAVIDSYTLVPSTSSRWLEAQLEQMQKELREEQSRHSLNRVAALQADQNRLQQLSDLELSRQQLQREKAALAADQERLEKLAQDQGKSLFTLKQVLEASKSYDYRDQLEKRLEREYQEKLRATLAAGSISENPIVVLQPVDQTGEAQILIRQRGRARLRAIEDQVRASLQAVDQRIDGYVRGARQVLDQGPLSSQGLRMLIALMVQYVRDMGGDRDPLERAQDERTWVFRFESPSDGLQVAQVLPDMGFPDVEVLHSREERERGRRLRVRIQGAVTDKNRPGALNLSLEDLQRRALQILSDPLLPRFSERRVRAAELVARYFGGEAQSNAGVWLFGNQTSADQASRIMQLLGLPHRTEENVPFAVRVLDSFV